MRNEDVVVLQLLSEQLPSGKVINTESNTRCLTRGRLGGEIRTTRRKGFGEVCTAVWVKMRLVRMSCTRF